MLGRANQKWSVMFHLAVVGFLISGFVLSYFLGPLLAAAYIALFVALILSASRYSQMRMRYQIGATVLIWSPFVIGAALFVERYLLV
ncbi:MAG: hypothetical protein ED559_13370 [Phycisphaera sp.]|nr:MAG: hypothetical protein ED559_13370 [Phycisphaera sp.]